MTLINELACDNLITPATIDSRECIGNSLPKINLNFSNLKENDHALCDKISEILEAINDVLAIPKQSIISWYGTVVDQDGTLKTPEDVVENAILYPRVDGAPQMSWAVCTGATIGGITTPNLIGRFLVGTGTVNNTYPNFNDLRSNTYYLGETGGKELHRLTASEIPQLQTSIQTISLDTAVKSVETAATLQDIRTQPYTSPGPLQEVVTNVSFANTKQGFVQSTGQSLAGSSDNFSHENRPPFHSVYFLMRIK